MEGTSQSSRKRQNVSPPIDRLSALPNGVICRILSFLPTKLSASTSILAKRWRFLWAHVPSLYFSSSELRIIDIINRVMLLYKVESMNSLRLFYHGGAADDRSKFQLETCMIAAISRNIKKLEIFFHDPAILPRCIFTCKTLVDLTLRFCGYIPTTGTVCLPALKRLNLSLVSYESDKSLVNLLFGCPVLEELTISNVGLVGCACDITSPTIKRLTLSGLFRSPDCSKAAKVKIETPALIYLQLQRLITDVVSAGTLASLIEADIILDELRMAPSVLEFVDGLCNVTRLKLSSDQLKVPDSAFLASTTKFHNLTKLELVADGRFLSYFLGNADNLKVIITKYQVKCRMDPHQEAKCLSSHLKTVTFRDFERTEHEFELIRYFLWNAKVLKRMEIYPLRNVTDLKENFEALKRIALFPRGSVACELAFH